MSEEEKPYLIVDKNEFIKQLDECIVKGKELYVSVQN